MVVELVLSRRPAIPLSAAGPRLGTLQGWANEVEVWLYLGGSARNPSSVVRFMRVSMHATILNRFRDHRITHRLGIEQRAHLKNPQQVRYGASW